MKKISLLVIVSFQTLVLFSQSLVVTGDTIVFGDPSDFQLESHLYVKNVSSSTALVYCEKNVIIQNQTGTNNYCWGGTCYGENIIIYKNRHYFIWRSKLRVFWVLSTLGGVFNSTC